MCGAVVSEQCSVQSLTALQARDGCGLGGRVGRSALHHRSKQHPSTRRTSARVLSCTTKGRPAGQPFANVKRTPLFRNALSLCKPLGNAEHDNADDDRKYRNIL